MAPVLSCAGLSFSYGARQALREVGFAIPRGQFCALLGPNGAGKSTLFALLTRQLVAPKGEIAIAGVELRTAPRHALARLGVVFQQPTLDLDLTVEQNLRYFAALHGLPRIEAEPRIESCLALLNMAERRRERVRALNGGHRRRTEIARALIHRPDVLLLDEPTVGLDAASRAAITAFVHARAQEGLTVLWATHLTDEIADTDRVLILHQGAIIADDTVRAIRGEASLTERFLAMTGGRQ